MNQTKNVPLLDLSEQYEPIKNDIFKKFQEIFETKRFIHGPEVEGLEKETAEYCGTKFAVGVSSGSDALIIALMTEEIGHGDEVITTPFTFFATVGAISRVGAKPIFVDIDKDTFNMDVTQIEAKITPNTKAIMPVHLFGQMADMDAIMAIAKKHNLVVIEDSAQSIGGKYQSDDGTNYKSGAMGTYGCYSYFPSKNLGCMGDGGMVVTNDEAKYLKLKQMRNHGEVKRYHHQFIGGNFRIDALQAAVLRLKLPLLDAQHGGRQKNAAFYEATVKNDKVQLPVIDKKCTSIYNQYTLRTSDRASLQEHLNNKGIGNAIYYPIPLHLQECFTDLGHKKGDFPVSELACEEVLSIPIFGGLKENEVQRVVEALNSY
ncbi:transcriptional regulator [Candidatus Marinamargulisbacteria bacterium SCGC AAA071-K20]|nr:transcriptional regulator [Candidatus Marinamargulisbacteria bacterium SCGC AAA071-K20]